MKKLLLTLAVLGLVSPASALTPAQQKALHPNDNIIKIGCMRWEQQCGCGGYGFCPNGQRTCQWVCISWR